MRCDGHPKMTNATAVFVLCAIFLHVASSLCPNITSRAAWQAKPSKGNSKLQTPVAFVVIHHTVTPEACSTSNKCSQAMREMQSFHQDRRKWKDIGYNFCVGGDGNIYEGRGWNFIGSHAPIYNKKSIGICLIGNYESEEPNPILMERANKLIECGVEKGYIKGDYKLVGHRQVTQTLCPGEKLFKVVKKQPHFSEQV